MCYTEYFRVHESLHKRMKRPEQEACLPFRQITNVWRTDKTKRFGLGVVHGKGGTRKIRMRFVYRILWAGKSLSPLK